MFKNRMEELKTIQGERAKDERGQIRFVNDFDMTLIKRFYMIKNTNTTLIRGWRAHRIEQRWFYVLSGVFAVDLVKIDDWQNPDPMLPVQRVLLKAEAMKLLHIPAGYGTAFRALEADSELLVYADYPLVHAPLDDHTWDSDYFKGIEGLTC